MFKKNEPKFDKGDIAFTKKDSEKVIVMKEAAPDSDRNKDLGRCYLIRGSDNKFRVLYEFELMTLDEATAGTKVTY